MTGNLTLPEEAPAGIDWKMRLLPLLAVLLTGCSSVKTVRLPWNSRSQEQARLNAATDATPRTREDEILHPDPTKEFDPRAANFGSARSVSTKGASTSAFHFVDKTRPKSFATREFGTQGAWDSGRKYATNEAPTGESWFSRLTAKTKPYATKENWEADKTSGTRALPEGGRTFAARGRKQAELDSKGAAGMPMGGDRVSGESWSGDLKPLTIEDIRTLLNKN
jgi:hypothetical protein